MTLMKDLLHKIADPTLTFNERVQQRCQLAKRLEELGRYEAASEAMGELWRGVGERPALEKFDQNTAADVLLRVGALTGWLGSVKQIGRTQEKAKNLISESMRFFDDSGNEEKAVEAQTELAFCYWREGGFDEARDILRVALHRVSKTDSEVRAIALLRSGIVERSAKRLNDALRIYMEAIPIFAKCSDPALKAKFHNEFANVLNYLSTAEHRKDYVDRALIEYTEASYYFEQVGHTRYQACVENNLGFLYSTIGDFNEAHEHLDRAQALLTKCKDTGPLAQVDETRAKVLLKQGRETEAEKLVRSAVRVLEKGGEQSLYVEALTTQGIALARLGRMQSAHDALQLALKVAQEAGDLESAAQAAMTIIEECGAHLTELELGEIYERADELIGKTQNMATLRRLCDCARRVLLAMHVLPSPPAWTGFSFRDAVRRYEAHLIGRALKDADGMVSKAAQLLGFKHHQSLVSVLKSRHKQLLHVRTPIVPRKRSIIRAAQRRRCKRKRRGLW